MKFKQKIETIRPIKPR